MTLITCNHGLETGITTMDNKIDVDLKMMNLGGIAVMSICNTTSATNELNTVVRNDDMKFKEDHVVTTDLAVGTIENDQAGQENDTIKMRELKSACPTIMECEYMDCPNTMEYMDIHIDDKRKPMLEDTNMDDLVPRIVLLLWIVWMI